VPKPLSADGALGFWKRLRVWPTTREQRCWVHNRHILQDAEEPAHQGQRALQRSVAGPIRIRQGIGTFVETYQSNTKKRSLLTKDRDALAGVLYFPAEHWKHL